MPAAKKGRMAIGRAAHHVDLVRELVDHDVVRVRAVRHLHVFPRQDHRPAFPRFAARVVLDLVHDAVLVLDRLADHEFARIDDDADPAAIQLEAEVQHGHARLRGDADDDRVGEFEPVRGRKRLLCEKEARRFAQPFAILAGQVRQERQALERLAPQRVGNRVRAQRAIAAARVEPLVEFGEHRGGKGVKRQALNVPQSISFCQAAKRPPQIATPARK